MPGLTVPNKISLGKSGLYFDDKLFPYYLAMDPVTIEHDTETRVSRVTATFFTNGLVEIDPELETDDSSEYVDLIVMPPESKKWSA